MNRHFLYKIANQVTAWSSGGTKEEKTMRCLQKMGILMRPVLLTTPLLKNNQILLTLAQSDLVEVVRKSSDQIFDIFHLRQEKGFQTWSTPKITTKPLPVRTCPPPWKVSRLLRFGFVVCCITNLLRSPSVSKLFYTNRLPMGPCLLLSSCVEEFWFWRYWFVRWWRG